MKNQMLPPILNGQSTMDYPPALREGLRLRDAGVVSQADIDLLVKDATNGTSTGNFDGKPDVRPRAGNAIAVVVVLNDNERGTMSSLAHALHRVGRSVPCVSITDLPVRADR